MTTYTTIAIEKEGAVDWLTLNRPAQLNALDTVMCDELRDYFGGLRENDQVRVVVMRGAGRHFCAGLDLKDIEPLTDPNNGLKIQRAIADIVTRMRRAPQPVIALVHGAAAGAGLAFSLGSDVRYAAEGARFNVAMAKIGLTGCDLGISYHLTRAVGMSVASEMMMTGRFVDAQRALRIGLVSDVAPSVEALEALGRTLAQEMLAISPLALRLTKEGVSMAVDAPGLEAAMALEDRQQVLMLSMPDFREGVSAFKEKRPPVWDGHNRRR